MSSFVTPILFLVGVLVVVYVVKRTFILVRQAETAIVERLGKYQATLTPGLSFIIPLVDRVVARIDMREQVVVFQPQSVITKDNLVVEIDSVVYFQVSDPKRSTYEIENYLQAIEQLSVTTLRNVIGNMDLEQTLTSRDAINSALRTALDETTGGWGVRVSRVELRAITPPPNVQQAMEAQMRAEREKRAAILTTEGQQQSAATVAEGEKNSAILRAEDGRQSAILRAEGEAKAMASVMAALREANVDECFLDVQRINSWRTVAAYPSNQMWMLPQDLTSAVSDVAQAFAPRKGGD